jgi:hypothetical protein
MCSGLSFFLARERREERVAGAFGSLFDARVAAAREIPGAQLNSRFRPGFVAPPPGASVERSRESALRSRRSIRNGAPPTAV